MKRYKYVIVASDGSTRDLASEVDFPWGRDLVKLLADGWRPERECAMGAGKWYPPPALSEDPVGTDNAYALVLLSKDTD
jgi:hypothetical protein